MIQSEWVARAISEHVGGIEVELVEIRTSGDRIRDVPLGPHLGQSFFTKEIEVALLERRIDLAVHSCKDLATTITDGLCLAAVPPREDPRDALVSSGAPLLELPSGARVGTSSPRRKGFLGVARPDLVVQDQRGNVPTRLRAVENGEVDAVVLAVAGLRRLGLEHRITETLDEPLMVPAASQGALAVQTREDDEKTRRAVAHLDDAPSRARVTAERACLHTLGAGCQAPVGALASIDNGQMHLHVAVVTPEGVVRVDQTRALATGAWDASATELGMAAGEALLARLGLTSMRDAEWAGAAPQRQGT